MSEFLGQSQGPSHIHYQLAIMAEEATRGTREILSRQGKKLGVSF